MCKSEYLDRTERKFHPSYEELREESNARHVHNALKKQGISLSYTTEEWIRCNSKKNLS
jgi:hypothetical protein